MGSYPITPSSIAGACRGVIIPSLPYWFTYSRACLLACLLTSLLSSQSVCGLCGTEPPTTHHRGLWMASSDARHPRCGPADPTAQPKGPQRHNSPSAMLGAAKLGSARPHTSTPKLALLATQSAPTEPSRPSRHRRPV